MVDALAKKIILDEESEWCFQIMRTNSKKSSYVAIRRETKIKSSRTHKIDALSTLIA